MHEVGVNLPGHELPPAQPGARRRVVEAEAAGQQRIPSCPKTPDSSSAVGLRLHPTEPLLCTSLGSPFRRGRRSRAAADD
jgi:hypothetical protein